MYIERLRVEAEGFLAGLDVTFTPGLNVVIGARGTGKTSLLELIRFCVDAGAFTKEAETRGRQQAIATLDGGAVTLTIRDGTDVFEITRSASGHQTSNATRRFDCTVLAQNEIETVGAQSSGRLHLIDRFRQERATIERATDSIRSQLRSLTEEIGSLILEVASLSGNAEGFASVPKELEDARHLQEAVLASSAATEEQQSALTRLQRASQVVATRDTVLERDADSVARFANQIEQARTQAPHILQRWPAEAGEDPYGDGRLATAELEARLDDALALLRALSRSVEEATASTKQLRATIDEQSRGLRQTLEAFQAGVGSASRKVAELEEKRGRLEALQLSITDRDGRISDIAAKRNDAYRELEDIRGAIFEQRSAIAEKLNSELGPTVHTRVIRSQNVELYEAAIVASLRGSGVHYNTLAPAIAREVSPFELAQWAERADGESFASALGISEDRAHSVLNAIRLKGTADLIAADIDDGVILELLDGLEYKPTDRLSIGQRCTAVLPILLGQHADPLVLDQPEDHLDNAFITSTLVPALLRRLSSDQFIFTSHNANIPVLGAADRVIVMRSDGERGRVEHQSNLDDPEIVSAVSRLMEGGREAFARRSNFYENAQADGG